MNKEELIEWLYKTAKEETYNDECMRGEDVVIDDYAGGNVDDAYWKGHLDGQVELSRQVIEILLSKSLTQLLN